MKKITVTNEIEVDLAQASLRFYRADRAAEKPGQLRAMVTFPLSNGDTRVTDMAISDVADEAGEAAVNSLVDKLVTTAADSL